MGSSRGTVSYEGGDYHDWNDHVDESQQHRRSDVHMLEGKVPLSNRPGRGISQDYSELSRNDSPLKVHDNDNDGYPWRPGGFRRFPYLGYIPLLLSITCQYKFLP